MTLSKPYDMLLSRNLHVSTSFKDKGCNHFALKSQEWFLTTILLIHNKAVENRQLHKVDGQLLVPLQCFARYLIGIEQLVSAVDSIHVLVVVSNTGWLCLAALISVSPVRPVHH